MRPDLKLVDVHLVGATFSAVMNYLKKCREKVLTSHGAGMLGLMMIMCVDVDDDYDDGDDDDDDDDYDHDDYHDYMIKPMTIILLRLQDMLDNISDVALQYGWMDEWFQVIPRHRYSIVLSVLSSSSLFA